MSELAKISVAVEAGSPGALQENLIQFEPMLQLLERVAHERRLEIVGHLLGCALLAYRDEMERRLAEGARPVLSRPAHPLNGRDWLVEHLQLGGK